MTDAANDGGPVRPTDEGRRRYRHTFGYHADISAKEDEQPDPDYPCTCAPNCLSPCAGECGCAACRLQYAIFCDYASFSLPKDAPEESFLRAYRFGEYR